MRSSIVCAIFAAASIIISSLVMSVGPAIGFGPPVSMPFFGPGTGAETVFQADPVTVKGMVSNVGLLGGAVEVDTGTEMITIFGMGPAWHWENNGSAFPSVGEPITIEANALTMSDGTKRIVATRATMYGQTIQLREQDTGIPVWRRSSWEYFQQMHNGNGNHTATGPGQINSQAPHFGPGLMGHGPTVPGGFMGWQYGPGHEWAH